MALLVPDLIWVDGAFRRGLAIEYSAASGRITRILDTSAAGPDPEAGPVIRLSERALVPGFVNAHSHAWMRLLRGRGQSRPAGEATADFRTWRVASHRAVSALGPDELFEVARFSFIEMLCAGFTSVGEFHGLHRDPAGSPYAQPAELAQRVIAAAASAGIRICLLNVARACGGIGRPLEPDERRFATPDLDAYLTETIGLADAVAGRPLVSVGVAPHSLGRVPSSWLGAMHSLAFGLSAPFHMRVSEQPAEVAASLHAFGRRPVEVLADAGVIDEHLTAVHATHLTFREVDLLGTPGPTVCACPSSERDRGDGFLAGRELTEAGARISLGTDSQVRIDPFEEMRLLEYHERLRRLERVILTAGTHGEQRAVAPALFAMGTEHGARSLRLQAGRLEAGACADFVALDLGHRALAGWNDDTLAAAIALTSPADVVSDVWVGGVQRVHGGRHPLDREGAAAFRAVASRIAT